MKPVNQRNISDKDGDCFDACMVSILELRDFPKWIKKTSQYIQWNEWLEKNNMQVVYYELGSFPLPNGYSILSVKSTLFSGGRHAVVMWSDEWTVKILHNPNPKDPRGVNIPDTEWLGISVIALIDPSKLGVPSI